MRHPQSSQRDRDLGRVGAAFEERERVSGEHGNGASGLSGPLTAVGLGRAMSSAARIVPSAGSVSVGWETVPIAENRRAYVLRVIGLGAQFTAEDFTKPLRALGIAISMDGKGRCLDNVFVERLWRSLKYEEVYLHAYDDAAEARAGIGRYMTFYNDERPHQSLGYQTPSAFYAGEAKKAA